MTKSWGVRLGCAFLVCLSVFVPHHAYASWPGRRGDIAFSADRKGQSRIFMMSSEGKNVERLSSGRWSDGDPSYSPHGRRIVFERVINDQVEIMVMRHDGARIKRLTQRGLNDLDPSWSANGKRVVYVRQFRSGAREVFTMRRDGSDQRRVTRRGGRETNPIWSPDGDRIAYIRGHKGLYTVAPDGLDRTLVVDWAQTADWSPTGDAFAVTGDGPDGVGLYTVDESGEGATLAAAGPAWWSPKWSPDGEILLVQKTLLLSTRRPGLYTMSANGSNRRRIRKTKRFVYASWQAR